MHSKYNKQYISKHLIITAQNEGNYTLKMKRGRRFFWRGILRLPYKVKVVLRYLLHLFKYKDFKFHGIEEIRGIHKGETLVLVGSGPSLETYPDNFIENKISMTLHLAYLKYSNPTYTHFTEGDRIPPLIEKYPDFFKTQGLYCNPLFPLDHPPFRLKGVRKMEKEPYYIKYSPKRLKFNNIENQIKAALTGEDIKFQTNSTCLHTGIWCAIILGFNNIQLIGCDHGSYRLGEDKIVKHYFSKAVVKDTRQRTQEHMEDGYLRMRVFTDEITRIASNYGISITRYVDYKQYLALECSTE